MYLELKLSLLAIAGFPTTATGVGDGEFALERIGCAALIPSVSPLEKGYQYQGKSQRDNHVQEVCTRLITLQYILPRWLAPKK